jgi:hypothetical protein
MQIVVHDLAQAMAAAQCAVAEGHTLTLRSPPNAGRVLGVSGWLALQNAVAIALPGADIGFCVDCGDHAGDAHAALTFGARQIALDPSAPGYARIADIAKKAGATILDGQPALDLAYEHDPAQAIRRAFLETTTT